MFVFLECRDPWGYALSGVWHRMGNHWLISTGAFRLPLQFARGGESPWQKSGAEGSGTCTTCKGCSCEGPCICPSILGRGLVEGDERTTPPPPPSPQSCGRFLTETEINSVLPTRPSDKNQYYLPVEQDVSPVSIPSHLLPPSPPRPSPAEVPTIVHLAHLN